MSMVTLGSTGICVNKNGFGALPVQRVTKEDAVYLLIFGANVSFGGTSIIIVVGVVLETLNQIESQLLVRNYKGFLNS